MPILSHVRLLVAFPAEAVQRVIDTWVRSLKDEAPTIYQKMLSQIPDMVEFQKRIAGPATTGFTPFVNPDFVNRSGEDAGSIKISQAANLARSYEKYAKKLAHIFETVDGVEAKRFKEMVDVMKSAYASGIASRLIPFTGTKIEGRGPAPLASLWLVKDITVLEQLRASDEVLEGGPFRICKPDQVAGFKAALNQRLIQAGAVIVKANHAAGVITAQNNRINSLITGFIAPELGLEPFSTGGSSHVDYIKDETERLWLEIQVTAI